MVLHLILMHTRNRMKICTALESRKTNSTIAKAFGVHRQTVVKWRREYHRPRFMLKEVCVQHILRLVDEDARGLNQGITLVEMEHACQCSRQKLYWILKDMVVAKQVRVEGATNSRRWYQALIDDDPF